MYLKNESTKIIGIGSTDILPGETAECPEGYEKNPVIRRYIQNGTFTETDGKADDTGKENAAEAVQFEKKLEDMTEEELLRYAAENGIDTGKATTKDGILKKIQEA